MYGWYKVVVYLEYETLTMEVNGQKVFEQKDMLGKISFINKQPMINILDILTSIHYLANVVLHDLPNTFLFKLKISFSPIYIQMNQSSIMSFKAVFCFNVTLMPHIKVLLFIL
jgi:hypothetical protein